MAITRCGVDSLESEAHRLSESVRQPAGNVYQTGGLDRALGMIKRRDHLLGVDVQLLAFLGRDDAR